MRKYTTKAILKPIKQTPNPDLDGTLVLPLLLGLLIATHFSLGLVLYITCTLLWQISAGSAIPIILGLQHNKGFTFTASLDGLSCLHAGTTLSHTCPSWLSLTMKKIIQSHYVIIDFEVRIMWPNLPSSACLG